MDGVGGLTNSAKSVYLKYMNKNYLANLKLVQTVNASQDGINGFVSITQNMVQTYVGFVKDVFIRHKIAMS